MVQKQSWQLDELEKKTAKASENYSVVESTRACTFHPSSLGKAFNIHIFLCASTIITFSYMEHEIR